MSSGKRFDEIDENALGEVSGAGSDEQRKKLLEIIGSAPPIEAHPMYAVTIKDFYPPKKDEKDDGKPEKIDENVLNKVNGGRSSWDVLAGVEVVPAYGAPLGMHIFKNLPLDKDSKDKDKKENGGETGENKS